MSSSSYLHDGLLLYLDTLIDWDAYYSLAKGDSVDVEAEKDALRGVLETCAEICAELESDAREDWATPAELVDGKVVLPPATQAAYDRLREVGLVALGVREEYGGYDLPAFIINVIIELVSRMNPGLMTILGLQAGVAEDIQKYGSEELCQQYLPKLASGEFQGAMDLTEPQAGSDLGGIQTRAIEEDGRVFLDGQKIFITNGGCEVHLVLARDDATYDASKGTTKGLSLYLCPRTLPDGTANKLVVERLEHKMGIHGSPTAALRFDRAEAFLIGVKGDGFKAMLDLMNTARVGVAAQGLGIAQASFVEALRYARERKQFGRAIGDQPLMKNLLSRMAINVEGSRALLYRCLILIDRNRAIERRLENPAGLSDAESAELQRIHERNSVRIRLLTPLSKYIGTETADWISRRAIQVHGGIGFMAESTVGKLHNDAIITTIYEGTSEIQVSFALKEIGKGALAIVFDELYKELDGLKNPALAPLADRVRTGIGRIDDASGALTQDFNYALLCAQPLADMVISVIVGSELLLQADAAPQRIDLAASWVNRRMVELEASARRIESGGVERLDRCDAILSLFD